MATELKDVMAYLLKAHPDWPNGLTDTRLNNLAYLADWHQAVRYNGSVSGIKWHFSRHEGCYTFDMKETAEENKDTFSVPDGEIRYFSLKDQSFQPQLDDKAKESLDLVIGKTESIKDSDEFRERVNKTYPMSFFEAGKPVDLLKMAKAWRKIQADKCV